MSFFENYPQFFKTSATRHFKNRLEKRYDALIKNNIQIIKDKRILDLASHDGRWSFAAIKNGSSFVFGIEINPTLVVDANKNMERYKISKEKYSFVIGDIFNEISKLKPKQFDTVFCFGIFYHITSHYRLLSEIKRLKPKHLVLDTMIVKDNRPIIEFWTTLSKDLTIKVGDSSHGGEVIRGTPSKSALELMLKNLRFDFQYYDWESAEITNWQSIEDYLNGFRVSLVAKDV